MSIAMCKKIAFFACVTVISLSCSVWSAVEKEEPDFTFIQAADPQLTFCENSIANWHLRYMYDSAVLFLVSPASAG